MPQLDGVRVWLAGFSFLACLTGHADAQILDRLGVRGASSLVHPKEAPNLPGQRGREKQRDFYSARPSSVRLQEMGVAEAQARKSSATRPGRPPVIGFPREVAALSTTDQVRSAIAWDTNPRGAHITTIRIESPSAAALRAGIVFDELPSGALIRVHGPSDSTTREVKASDILELIALNTATGDNSDKARTYWTPPADGAVVEVEIELPVGASPSSVVFRIPRVSHIYQDGKSKAQGFAGALAAAASCNLDVSCYSSTWGSTATSVARMSYVTDDGVSSVCTGTLINDRAGSLTPYFLSANHCVNSQLEASSLITWWSYQSASCNNFYGSGYQQTLSGGAVLLHADSTTDVSFLRLRDPAPAGTYFAGWSPNLVPLATSVAGIHHPRGDWKKISFGTVSGYKTCTPTVTGFSCVPTTATSSTFLEVPWTAGVTESGSSGSGLWITLSGQQYLVGQLYGGNSSCVAPYGYSAYGRFDVSYQSALRRWLDNSQSQQPTLLQMPWFTAFPGYISRFVLLNTGSRDAPYSIAVGTEAGNSVTTNSNALSGVIPARSQKVINASDVVTSFAVGQRGFAVIGVDSWVAGDVVGIYNLVQPATGAISNVSLQPSVDLSGNPPTTLISPWFTLDPAYQGDFILTNVGATPATFQFSFLTPSGTTASPKIQSVVVQPDKQVVISAGELISLSGGNQAAAVLSVNSSNGLVKGTYKVFNRSTGSASSTELVNPAGTTGSSTRLVIPWFSVYPGYASKFVLTNRGGTSAQFTIRVLTEPGNVATPGGFTGTIPANSQVIVPAETVVRSFSSVSRGAAVIDVQASPSVIDGMYQILSLATGAISNTIMDRALANSTTATTLKLPWFSTASGYVSRITLVNTNAYDVEFALEVMTEKTNAALQRIQVGTVKANSQLVLPLSDAVSWFLNNTRGSAVVTANASSSSLFGLYNIVNPATGTISNTMLMK